MTHFQVFGERPVLYQWDTGRRVIVLCDCQEVHFSNALDGEALVVATYEEGGTRYANIPNILLQSALPLNVYAYVCAGERYTQRATVLEVNPRSKPADYVYTETEVKNYDALAKLITALGERLTDLERGGIPGSVAEPDLVIGFNRIHVLADTISASTFYVESGSLSAIKEMVLSGKSPNIKIRCVLSGAGKHTEYNFTPSGHYYNFKTGDDYIIIEFVARFGSSLKEYTMKSVGEDIELNRFTEASSANIVSDSGGGGSAEVTADSIEKALGYTPADDADVKKLSKEITDLENKIPTGGGSGTDQYYEGSTVTAETDVEQRVIDAYQTMMSECIGDYDKIPFVLQTDIHNYFPTNVYNLCGKMINFPQISRVISLGDIVANYYKDDQLQRFADAMSVFPIKKRITIAGNHDVWAGATERVYIDQSKLATYLKNYTMHRKGKNVYGVVTDDYFNVKYLITSNYDKEMGEGGSQISTEQVDFIIEELSKNDGYDVVILTHEPMSISDSTATHLLEEGAITSTGNYFNYIPTKNGYIQMILARKTKGNGTYTDDEGVDHAYDFTNCKSDLLCYFCGHMHVEAFDFIGNELLLVAYGSICKANGNPIYFGYIDRKNRLLRYYRAAGEYSSFVTVGLDKVSATGMTIDKSEISMDIGSMEVIRPIFTPTTAGNQRITWTSDNESVATVTKGFVTSVSSGVTTITAVSEDGGFTATCVVTVSGEVKVDSITLDETATVNVGKTYTLSPTISPANATEKTLDWISDNETIATVNDGVVTGLSVGTATITCSATDGSGVTATCTVTVKAASASNNLPSEYQEVEYLYTTGDSVASVSTTTNFSAGDRGCMTVEYNAKKPSMTVVCGLSSKCKVGVENSVFAVEYNVTLIAPTSGTPCVLDTVYDVEFEFTSELTDLILMAYNTSHKYGFHGKLYSVKFYRGDTMIYNFVPCYRKSDGVIGVYDTVNNTFSAGSGELFKGDDV